MDKKTKFIITTTKLMIFVFGFSILCIETMPITSLALMLLSISWVGLVVKANN